MGIGGPGGIIPGPIPIGGIGGIPGAKGIGGAMPIGIGGMPGGTIPGGGGIAANNWFGRRRELGLFAAKILEVC
jgi:hypothetical protein